LVPVHLQLEDGIQAKVQKLVRSVNPKTGLEERVPQDLTGREEIIPGGQGELSDGQAVIATALDG
jgi:hypothetical protein